MPDDDSKQYLVQTLHRDGSRGRAVMTLAEIRKKFEIAPFRGATITIEEL